MASADTSSKGRLAALAHALRSLHRALAERARRDLETERLTVIQPGAWLSILTTDPRFGWAVVRSLAFATSSTIGCFVFGSSVMMSVKAIGISTPPENPCTARSTIICGRFCANAHAAENTRNRIALARR